MPDVKRLDAIEPAKVSTAALNTFLSIVDAWGLSQTEAMTILGFEEKTRSTYFKWKRDPGIYKALQELLPNPTRADAWIKRPNTAALFNGESALSRMLSGNVADLYVVRRYLDAERGW